MNLWYVKLLKIDYLHKPQNNCRQGVGQLGSITPTILSFKVATLCKLIHLLAYSN